MNSQNKVITPPLSFLSLLYKYGRAVNTHDLIKVAAIALMVVDHLGFYFFDNNPIMRFIGRGAAPLFYFLIGYSGKLNCRPSLFIYATVLSLSSMLIAGKYIWLNILFTFILAHVIFVYFPLKKTPTWVTISLVVALVFINSLIYPYVEYGTLGILIALSVRWHTEGLPHSGIWLTLAIGYHFLWQIMSFNLFSESWSIYGIIAMGVLYWGIFYYYRLLTIGWYPQWIVMPTLFISRYSLEIYFWHLILFQAIYLVRYYQAYFG